MKLLVLPGDGVGPEITDATLAVLAAAAAKFGLDLSLERRAIGFAALEAHGSTIPDEVIEAARAADGAILGPVSHNEYPPVAQGGRNPSGVLRAALDLYANIRPAKARPGVRTATGRPIDLVIMRENTEGFYSDRSMFLGPGEFMPTPDLALSMRKVTADGSRRIAEAAFTLARRRGGKVTAVHKANVLRVSDGLFLRECRAVAADNADIGYDEALVDAVAALLVRDAGRYDVIVTTNMFGDILSDEASELAGGLGLAGSLNAGAEHAVAQAQHGSAPDIAGRGVANPSSLILSAAMLLDWLGGRAARPEFGAAATAMETALDACLAAGQATPDLGGGLSTADFAAALAGRIHAG